MIRGQRLFSLERHPAFATAVQIISRLHKTGEAAVLAGGCVRDALLGVTPKDLDIATSARPDNIEVAFPRTLAVGKAFGTIVVVENGENFEVTTFRKDGPYLDGRRPSRVDFADMREDAERRDFTVNALFYDPIRHEISDFTGGVADLEAKSLRAVGEPLRRFQEDRLRMLRAARFVAQLEFSLEAETEAAIVRERAELKAVSAERVLAEMKRLLGVPGRILGLEVLKRTGLFESCWPELASFDPKALSAFPSLTGWENAFAAICLLTHSDPEPRLREWKASRDSLRRVELQLEALRVLNDPKSTRAARVRVLGADVYAEILALAAGRVDSERVGEWVEEFLAVATQEGTLPPPLLNGEDLRQRGIAPGEAMGRILKSVYDAQLELRVSSREEALELVDQIKA